MTTKFLIITGCLIPLLLLGCYNNKEKSIAFNPDKDIISLHYDHAPDKDDGHSAAADRTMLQSIYDSLWIVKHVVAVSGTYGKNANRFNSESDQVMDAVWKNFGGWLSAHTAYNEVLDKLTAKWISTLLKGGDVWVKEGGQSDITYKVLERINLQLPNINTKNRIHVVQHSDWNEKNTVDSALLYTKTHTNYIKIKDANAYLSQKGGSEIFINNAINHPVFGRMWKVAFSYLDPRERLDFSDTGELMYILGLGEIGIEEFRENYLIEESHPSESFRKFKK